MEHDQGGAQNKVIANIVFNLKSIHNIIVVA